jgi:hypothetical protein
MTGIAFFRKPLPALARPKLMRWALGGSNRGGQDKARKVRAVGWGPEYPRIPVLLQTLRNIPRNLRFSATRYCRSAFHTL